MRTLADANDCPPQFERAGHEYVLDVDEAAKVGQRVGAVHAADCDLGLNAALEYLLGPPLLPPPHQPPADADSARSQQQQQRTSYSAAAFELSRAGELTLRRELDRELVNEYRFVVLAVDRGTCAGFRVAVLYRRSAPTLVHLARPRVGARVP